jgi:hypothetical protein
MTLSNLPPGVTQRMIDATFEGPCPGCGDGEHDQCDGGECACPVCVEAAMEDYYESVAEEKRLEGRA